MRFEPIYQKNHLIGIMAISDNEIEAAVLKWAWEHEFRIAGFSQGITSQDAQLACSFEPVKREMFPKDEEVLARLKELRVKYHKKDGKQEKMI